MPRYAPPLTILMLLVALPPARAYDPDLRWWTLNTPHFQVHYHEGTYHLAVQAARDAEAALERITAVMQHIPDGPIQLVITDHTDTANASAQVIPYNTVHLLASPPGDLDQLGDYDDYVWIALVHELSHIVHMDTVSGLPAAVNWIFGRTAYPNGAQPGWFTEGVAVHFESSLSSAGRMRSSLFAMYLRTAALAGVFPGLDQVSGDMKDWPQGTGPYLYGSFFLSPIDQEKGDRQQRM